MAVSPPPPVASRRRASQRRVGNPHRANDFPARDPAVPAYVISEVEILDRDLIDSYRSLAKASIEQYGGRYIVRGGPVELVEGQRNAARQFVIVEFPTMERAHAWYRSPEY